MKTAFLISMMAPLALFGSFADKDWVKKTFAPTNAAVVADAAAVTNAQQASAIAGLQSSVSGMIAAEYLPRIADSSSGGAKTAVTIGSRIGSVGKASLANGNSVEASGMYSHAEGFFTKAQGQTAHAEGVMSKATANYSHAEGNGATASGLGSHAEGLATVASGNYSHASGYGSTAQNQTTFVWQGLDTDEVVINESTIANLTNESGRATNNYTDHGAGTFNINPAGGAEGFFIGGDSLQDLLDGCSDPNAVTNIFTNGISAVDGKIARITIPSTDGFIDANTATTIVSSASVTNAGAVADAAAKYLPLTGGTVNRNDFLLKDNQNNLIKWDSVNREWKFYGSSSFAGGVLWEKIDSTPDTISGYGITDAYTKTECGERFKTLSTPVPSAGAASKTPTLMNQNNNGDLQVTFSDIQISKNQITDLPDSYTKTEANNKFLDKTTDGTINGIVTMNMLVVGSTSVGTTMYYDGFMVNGVGGYGSRTFSWPTTSGRLALVSDVPTKVSDLSIDSTTTNVIREVTGTFWDPGLTVTWRMFCTNGNFYVSAITNVNITGVQP